MRSSRPSSRHGLTIFAVLVVVVCLLVLAGVFWAVLATARNQTKRIGCLNNLKSVGLALYTFRSNHGGKRPTDLSVTDKGSREWLADDGQIWRHWLTLSNELTTPKLLLCPADWQRQPPRPFFSAPNPLTWAHFTNHSQLSYFLGLNASGENSLSDLADERSIFLAGDRNLTTSGVPVAPGRLLLTTNLVLGFTEEMHVNQTGNVLLQDNSVQQVTSGRFLESWRGLNGKSKVSTNVWLVP